MLIPLDLVIIVRDLNEPHPGFGKPSSHQAHAGKVGGDRIVEAVQSLRRFGFGGQIFNLRQLRLHAKRQFERGDPCFQRRFRTGSSPDARDSSFPDDRAATAESRAAVASCECTSHAALSDGTLAFPSDVP